MHPTFLSDNQKNCSKLIIVMNMHWSVPRRRIYISFELQFNCVLWVLMVILPWLLGSFRLCVITWLKILPLSCSYKRGSTNVHWNQCANYLIKRNVIQNIILIICRTDIIIFSSFSNKLWKIELPSAFLLGSKCVENSNFAYYADLIVWIFKNNCKMKEMEWIFVW